MVAHNAGFDFGFINHELGQCGRPLVCTSRMVDTLAIARQKFPGAKHSLDALCTRFGVDRSQRIKHGALLDAQLLAQVYVELTGGRQIGLDPRRRADRRRQRSPRPPIRMRADRDHRPPGAAARARPRRSSRATPPSWRASRIRSGIACDPRG